MRALDPESFLSQIWPQQLLRFETLELRAIKRKDDTIKRLFVESREEFLERAEAFGDGWDIYFGVSTRFKQGGKKDDCYRCKVVWVDLDKKELPKQFIVKPDLIVSSGRRKEGKPFGHHVYWILEDPVLVKTGRWRDIEAVNRALAQKLGGDRMAVDIARILRVPGFKNWKYDPPQEVEAYAV